MAYLVHEGHKDYACDKCAKKFRDQSYLLVHQKSVHEGRKDYVCDKCEKKLTVTFGAAVCVVSSLAHSEQYSKYANACDTCDFTKMGSSNSKVTEPDTLIGIVQEMQEIQEQQSRQIGQLQAVLQQAETERGEKTPSQLPPPSPQVQLTQPSQVLQLPQPAQVVHLPQTAQTAHYGLSLEEFRPAQGLYNEAMPEQTPPGTSPVQVVVVPSSSYFYDERSPRSSPYTYDKEKKLRDTHVVVQHEAIMRAVDIERELTIRSTTGACFAMPGLPIIPGISQQTVSRPIEKLRRCCARHKIEGRRSEDEKVKSDDGSCSGGDMLRQPHIKMRRTKSPSSCSVCSSSDSHVSMKAVSGPRKAQLRAKEKIANIIQSTRRPKARAETAASPVYQAQSTHTGSETNKLQKRRMLMSFLLWKMKIEVPDTIEPSSMKQAHSPEWYSSISIVVQGEARKEKNVESCVYERGYVGRVSDNDDHRDSRTRSAVCVPVKCTSYIVRVSRWHREQQQCEHLLRDVQVIDETRRRSEDESRERLRRPLKHGADPRSVRRSYLATEKRRGSITRTRTERSVQRAVVGMAS
ncbi:unnamed protein product, partial [Trichogramma brassicae]